MDDGVRADATKNGRLGNPANPIPVRGRTGYVGAPMTESSMVWRDSLPGRLIGERYLVEKRIAEGAAGYVFRAFDQQHERLVAVKVLKADAAFHEQIRKRFVNEVRTTMTIDSPHVVQIFDVGELEDGSPFYAMEFLEGVTLDEYRVDTLEMVKRIAIQICRGLAAAHEKGVVHRDLKPEKHPRHRGRGRLAALPSCGLWRGQAPVRHPQDDARPGAGHTGVSRP